MYRFFSEIQWKVKFKLIEIYGLYGPSGTGKSHNAFLVMNKYKISSVLDDGLLIHEGRIITGISAKRAPTTIEAVRRAIFFSNEHKENIENHIKSIQPKKILILGTSKRMIIKIIKRLGLSPPKKFISIYEISNEEKIKKANYYRKVENKHVIPVPAIEIIKKFPGNLVDSFDFLIKKKFIQKSIVRPFFNTIGTIKISKKVIISFVYSFFIDYTKKKSTIKLNNFKLHYSSNKLNKKISLEIFIDIAYGSKINEVIHSLQTKLKKYIEYYTGLEINSININVDKINK